MADDTLHPDSSTNDVELRIDYIKQNIDQAPPQVRPIVAWALAAANLPHLSRYRRVSEVGYFKFPVPPAERESLRPYGTFDSLGLGIFFFDLAAKTTARHWLRRQAINKHPQARGRKGHYYSMRLDNQLGWVRVDNLRLPGGTNWYVDYALPARVPLVF